MRLIDADALYEVVTHSWDVSDSEDFEKSVFIAIATAPTINPVKWIPVTERLPEKSGHYLITVVSDVTDGEPTVFTDDYFFHGWDDWEEDVVAWAIKPEPWRGEEDGNI